MSGKDFYEDDSNDPSKYYRPTTATTGSFFATPATGGADSQENMFRDHVNAFGAPGARSGYGTVPPASPVMSGSIDPMPSSDQVHEDISFRDDANLIHEKPAPAAPQDEPAPEGMPVYSWWQPEYYRYLFNVDTNEVGHRLLKALVPWPPTFINIIRQNPDLYGPFWITTTVVFLMGAASNFASYLNWAFKSDRSVPWEYEFNYVSFSALAIYGYNLILPLILWGTCKCLDIGLSLLDCLCIYGYALCIYIPVALLAVAPSEIMRWILVAVAGVISTLFLGGNLFMELKSNLKYGLLIIAAVALLNIGLALTFKLYFFQLADYIPAPPTNTTAAP